MARTVSRVAAAALVAGAAWAATFAGVTATVPPPAKTRQIRIAYDAPKNPAHQPILDAVKAAHLLEKLQVFLGPLRLPRPLLLRIQGCDGVSNAWYEEDVVTVCYEALDDIWKAARSDQRPAYVSERAALAGPVFDLFLHETGHAIIDLLQLPILGREEDAADALSAYVMLQFGRDQARDLLAGAAYAYAVELRLGDARELSTLQVTQKLESFADEHATPAQRLYTLLCVAYGADSQYFARLVDQGWLPRARAEGCEFEYWQIAHAYKALVAPHVDPKLAKEVRAQPWLRAAGARPAASGAAGR